jgi:hypothetical protein
MRQKKPSGYTLKKQDKEQDIHTIASTSNGCLARWFSRHGKTANHCLTRVGERVELPKKEHNTNNNSGQHRLCLACVLKVSLFGARVAL